MAWLLLGLAGGAVISYVGSTISDTWDGLTKPVHQWFDDKEREANICQRENIRQANILDAKQRKKSYQNLEKWTDTSKYQTTLTNNTEDCCFIIFVNKDRATTADGAIQWAQRELEANILERTN